MSDPKVVTLQSRENIMIRYNEMNYSESTVEFCADNGQTKKIRARSTLIVSPQNPTPEKNPSFEGIAWSIEKYRN